MSTHFMSCAVLVGLGAVSPVLASVTLHNEDKTAWKIQAVPAGALPNEPDAYEYGPTGTQLLDEEELSEPPPVREVKAGQSLQVELNQGYHLLDPQKNQQLTFTPMPAEDKALVEVHSMTRAGFQLRALVLVSDDQRSLVIRPNKAAAGPAQAKPAPNEEDDAPMAAGAEEKKH